MEGCKTYRIQTRLELVDLGLLHQKVLFVQFLDDEVVLVLAVDLDQHGLYTGVALDEHAPDCFDHDGV